MKQRYILMDRDGVINNNAQNYYVYKKEDYNLNEGVLEFIRNVVQKGYYIIVISNQSGIAKGIYTKQDVDSLHAYFLQICMPMDLYIKEFYFCPHHPDFSECICRKPGTILLEKAIARFNIDVENSYFIGDSERDIEAAKKVNLIGIKTEPNSDLMNYIDQIQ